MNPSSNLFSWFNDFLLSAYFISGSALALGSSMNKKSVFKELRIWVKHK